MEDWLRLFLADKIKEREEVLKSLVHEKFGKKLADIYSAILENMESDTAVMLKYLAPKKEENYASLVGVSKHYFPFISTNVN